MKTPIELHSNRNFLLLWNALFFTSAGTILVLLTLSLKIYQETHSAFLAGAVFGVQWILPIVGLPILSRLCHHNKPRTLLMASELPGALLTLAIGFIYDDFFIIVLVVLLLRGFFEALTKSSVATGMRLYIAEDQLEKKMAVIETGRFVGYSVGALAGSLLIPVISVRMITAIDALTFVIAGVLAFFLPAHVSAPSAGKSAVEEESKEITILNVFTRNPALKIHMILLSVIIVFQGFHNIARTVLPLHHLKIGIEGASILTFFSSIAISVGSYLASKLVAREGKQIQSPLGTIIITNAFMISAVVFSNQIVISIACYFFFLTFFEISFVISNNRLQIDCHKSEIGKIAAFKNSSLPLVMATSIFLLGFVSDHFPFLSISLFIAAGTTLLAVFAKISLKSIIENRKKIVTMG